MPDIKGYFRVNKNRATASNIPYTVLVSANGLIFARAAEQTFNYPIATLIIVVLLGSIGGSLWGLLGAVLGGGVGGLIGSFIDGKLNKSKAAKSDETVKHYSQFSIDEIIKGNKNNFYLSYPEIESISVKRAYANLAYGARSGVLTITLPGQKPQQYDIAVKSDFTETAELLKQSLDKLQIID